MNESPYQSPSAQSNPVPYNQPEMMNMNSYRVVYPEIFYRVQPYIMNVCDQMDSCGFAMPTQDIIDKMSDGIYDDMCRMHPDLVEYAHEYENKSDVSPSVAQVINGFGNPFTHNFRRRGLLRDLISILLLSEFHRRRRRY